MKHDDFVSKRSNVKIAELEKWLGRFAVSGAVKTDFKVENEIVNK